MSGISRITPDYVGNQANRALSHAIGHLHNAFDRIRATINNIGAAFRSASYGLRQEVPFERWFYDHGFQKPLDDPMELMKARTWALLSVVEGGIRILAELASSIYAQVMEPNEAERHLDVLKAQWQGFTLSLLAVVSPNMAKEKAHNSEGQPLIGSSILNWKWGTLYTGNLDIPLWHLECRQYPWIDRPVN